MNIIHEQNVSMGIRIAQLRKDHDMTQEVLSEILDVSPKHISHVECGTSSLSLKYLIQICQIFNCSLDYLIFGKESNPALSQLPDGICNILYSDNQKEQERLQRYLNLYLELSNR